jgi:hypothetical protein
MAASFVQGRNFVDVFDTELGSVRVVAHVSIMGDHLVLDDFAIFPKGRTRSMAIGVPQVVRIIGQIKRNAKQAGFTRITVRAERLTGANPGRMITIERSLL